MDFDHDNVRLTLTEDRLNMLPDELIYKILSCLDTKFAVQTCLLSPRWKFLWKSVSGLNFSTTHFDSLPKFAKFVKHVLSNRNHQIEVPIVKLDFRWSANQDFIKNITNYAVSHNVQNLTVISGKRNRNQFPSCLFSSHSLKHLTLSSSYLAPRVIPVKPWGFPALITLHLSNIRLGDEHNSGPLDMFSKCVSLKNLTLKDFVIEPAEEVFDIITPQLTNLILENGDCTYTAVNVIAHKLENLTVISCSIKYLNVPPGILSFCYKGYKRQGPPQMPDYSFHSVNNVILHFNICDLKIPYKEYAAREIINMLEKLHNARFLTLNLDIVECLSLFPDLVSQTPSPFSNLISVSIDSNRNEPYKVKISSETRNFFLENSPNATFVTDLPEEPPTKEMLAEQAREKRVAKVYADIAIHMTKLQELLLNQENRLVERKEAKEKTKIALENLEAEVHVWEKKLIMQTEPERAQIAEVLAGLQAQFKARLGEMQNLIKKKKVDDFDDDDDFDYDDDDGDYFSNLINAKKDRIEYLLRRLHGQQREEMETQYSQQLQQRKIHFVRLAEEALFSDKIINAYKNKMSDYIPIFKNVASSKLPRALRPYSSSPIEPPTKEMLAEHAKDKRKAKLFTYIASEMMKLQAYLLDKENKYIEIKHAEKKTKIALHNLVEELQAWRHKFQIEPNKAQIEEFVAGLEAQFKIREGKMHQLINQKHNDVSAIVSKKYEVELLFDKLSTQHWKEVGAHFRLHQLELLRVHLISEASYSRKIIDSFRQVVFHYISELKNIFNTKLLPASQPSASAFPQVVDFCEDIDVGPQAVDLGKEIDVWSPAVDLGNNRNVEDVWPQAIDLGKDRDVEFQAVDLGKGKDVEFQVVDRGEKKVVHVTQDSTPVNSPLEGTGGTSTKRKRSKSIDDLIRVYSKSCKMLNNTIIAINKNLSKMANHQETKVQDGIHLMRRVQREINTLPGITFEEAFEATNIIGKCPLNAEMFFGYDLERKVRMVQMVARKSTG